MGQRLLTMTMKELDRTKTIERIRQGELTVALAAESLAMSERQLYRCLKRYAEAGDEGLIHRLRGKASNAGYSIHERKTVVQLYDQLYPDYGPTLFAEMLAEHHAMQVSPETLRQWLMAESRWAGTRAKRPHRQHRERRSAIGALVQLDGSPHDWFEERGPSCTLLLMVDDASSRSHMRLAPSETTRWIFVLLQQYFMRFGLPTALYSDHGSVFDGGTTHTDYQRALIALGVQYIFAHSPQAKGRVERNNATHQDRLVKALRRENISDIDRANAFLHDVYTDRHNRAFAHTDNLPDVHRPLGNRALERILCFETTRKVTNDYTISLGGKYIQLLRGEASLPPPRTTVIVRRYLDDSLHVSWNENELPYSLAVDRPKLTHISHRKPAAEHPWRHKLVGKGSLTWGVKTK